MQCLFTIKEIKNYLRSCNFSEDFVESCTQQGIVNAQKLSTAKYEINLSINKMDKTEIRDGDGTLIGSQG